MIGDLMAGMSLAKGVVDLAKGLKELSDKSDDLEIKEAAAELRSKTIDLKEIVNEMREKILELKEQVAFKEKLNFNGKVWEYEKDGKKSYICNGCEASGKYVHMTEEMWDNDHHDVLCPVCKNEVTLKRGSQGDSMITRYCG